MTRCEIRERLQVTFVQDHRCVVTDAHISRHGKGFSVVSVGFVCADFAAFHVCRSNIDGQRIDEGGRLM
jgi:hypothetical protein